MAQQTPTDPAANDDDGRHSTGRTMAMGNSPSIRSFDSATSVLKWGCCMCCFSASRLL